jgi:hypothetical protein
LVLGAYVPWGGASRRPFPTPPPCPDSRHRRPPAGSRATLFAACSPDAWRLSLPTGGFFNADTRPAVLSPAQADGAAAAWLWDWSARQVKLPWEWDLPATPAVGAVAARSAL